MKTRAKQAAAAANQKPRQKRPTIDLKCVALSHQSAQQASYPPT